VVMGPWAPFLMDSEHLRVAWAHLDPIQVPLEQIQGLLEIYLSASSRFGFGTAPLGFGGPGPFSAGSGALGPAFGSPGGLGFSSPGSGALGPAFGSPGGLGFSSPGSLGRFGRFPGSVGSQGAYQLGYGSDGAFFSHNQNNLGYHYDLTLPGGNYQTVTYSTYR